MDKPHAGAFLAIMYVSGPQAELWHWFVDYLLDNDIDANLFDSARLSAALYPGETQKWRSAK